MAQQAVNPSAPPPKPGFFSKIFGHHNGSSKSTPDQVDPGSPTPDPSPSPAPTSDRKDMAQDSESSSRPDTRRHASYDVVPGLPRAQTFKRQQSEQRTHLEPVTPTPDERRAMSVGRSPARLYSPLSHVLSGDPRVSAPGILGFSNDGPSTYEELSQSMSSAVQPHLPASPPESLLGSHHPSRTVANAYPASDYSYEQYAPSMTDGQSSVSDHFNDLINVELDQKWILNLSMHFRDRSRREKFFVTYRQESHSWRRVTISLDYRDAPPGSLEADLAKTRYQRDKIAKIYEAIRESLPDIQWYDTVTNLKLETRNERLHVHVVEDGNEIIKYPIVAEIEHLNCRRIKERDIKFESHMSGFVYKVTVDNRVLIKKEIPSPDTIEEFRYEINSLSALGFSEHVIDLYGVVVDDDDSYVKGLLISYADQGSLIDILYEHREQRNDLSWATREKWARQIIQGLAHIHESGFVQGDFTLSNIVITKQGDAKIIDINRRGCPIGWEPPEAGPLLRAGQRIAMYIGNKSDLYQLGMVLWSIAMLEDEPERRPRPLNADACRGAPAWYRQVTATCLENDPRKRLQAALLLEKFPELGDGIEHAVIPITPTLSSYDRARSPSEERTSGGAMQYMENPTLPDAGHYYAEADTSSYEQSHYPPSRGRSPPRPMSRDPRAEYGSIAGFQDRSTWSDVDQIPRSYNDIKEPTEALQHVSQQTTPTGDASDAMKNTLLSSEICDFESQGDEPSISGRHKDNANGSSGRSLRDPSQTGVLLDPIIRNAGTPTPSDAVEGTRISPTLFPEKSPEPSDNAVDSGTKADLEESPLLDSGSPQTGQDGPLADHGIRLSDSNRAYDPCNEVIKGARPWQPGATFQPGDDSNSHSRDQQNEIREGRTPEGIDNEKALGRGNTEPPSHALSEATIGLDPRLPKHVNQTQSQVHDALIGVGGGAGTYAYASELSLETMLRDDDCGLGPDTFIDDRREIT